MSRSTRRWWLTLTAHTSAAVLATGCLSNGPETASADSDAPPEAAPAGDNAEPGEDIVTATLTGPVDFHRLSEGLATRVALTADGQPVTSGTPEGAQIRAVTGFNFAEYRQLFLAVLCV